MIDALRFLRLAWRAYREARVHGLHYCGVFDSGVCQLAVFVGVGREAWRVTERAVDARLLELK